MGIKKQYLKSKPVCKVSFKLEKDFVGEADKVQILGNFNNWDMAAEPITKLKSGAFSTTLELPIDSSFEFRYLIDGNTWLNEPDAEGYVSNEFGEENFIITT